MASVPSHPDKITVKGWMESFTDTEEFSCSQLISKANLSTTQPQGEVAECCDQTWEIALMPLISP